MARQVGGEEYMAEGSMSPEAVVRRNNDIRRQEVGMAQAGLCQAAGIDWVPGEPWTKVHQTAFDSHLRLKQAWQDAQKPKNLWQKVKGAIGF